MSERKQKSLLLLTATCVQSENRMTARNAGNAALSQGAKVSFLPSISSLTDHQKPPRVWRVESVRFWGKIWRMFDARLTMSMTMRGRRLTDNSHSANNWLLFEVHFVRLAPSLLDNKTCFGQIRSINSLQFILINTEENNLAVVCRLIGVCTLAKRQN